MDFDFTTCLMGAKYQAASMAQSAVSGYSRGQMQNNLSRGTGATVPPHSKGSQTITVTIFWINGNLVKVVRR